MLGNHADHFMLSQMRENVTAITPNAGSAGLKVPDRERAGAPHIKMKAGFGMPGPQRVVSSQFIPGRGALPGMSGVQRSGALPGMGHSISYAPYWQSHLAGDQPGGALPGMSGGALPGMSGVQRSGALPGMGDITFSTTTVLGIAAIAGLYLWAKSRKAA